MKRFDVELVIGNIRNSLEKKYGEISSDWETQLVLLENDMIMYNRTVDTIENTPMTDVQGRRNMLIVVNRDLANQINKVLGDLGATPLASGRLKLMEKDTTGDFVDNLMN